MHASKLCYTLAMRKADWGGVPAVHTPQNRDHTWKGQSTQNQQATPIIIHCTRCRDGKWERHPLAVALWRFPRFAVSHPVPSPASPRMESSSIALCLLDCWTNFQSGCHLIPGSQMPTQHRRSKWTLVSIHVPRYCIPWAWMIVSKIAFTYTTVNGHQDLTGSCY